MSWTSRADDRVFLNWGNVFCLKGLYFAGKLSSKSRCKNFAVMCNKEQRIRNRRAFSAFTSLLRFHQILAGVQWWNVIISRRFHAALFEQIEILSGDCKNIFYIYATPSMIASSGAIINVRDDNNKQTPMINEHFIQLHGTAMGTRTAPAFANLFIGDFF